MRGSQVAQDVFQEKRKLDLNLRAWVELDGWTEREGTQEQKGHGESESHVFQETAQGPDFSDAGAGRNQGQKPGPRQLVGDPKQSGRACT